MGSPADKSLAVACRVYSLLLLAYPLGFRREYGPQMAQVFRDTYRAEKRRSERPRMLRLWFSTLIDVLRTAPKERLEEPGRGVAVMKAIRNLVIAIVIYAVVFVLTGKLLVSARPNLPFVVGSFIDALVSTGILFNFIVLVLVSTRLMPATRAVVTAAVATIVLIGGALSIIATRVPPAARPGGTTVLTLALSLIIWFGLHWFWAQRKTSAQPAT